MKGSESMPKKIIDTKKSDTKPRTAFSPEARENQLIALAVDLAEEQLRNGTASSQVITHYLKLGTMRERLEREKLEKENQLLTAKTEMIKESKNTAELYKEAIKAFASYSGNKDADV